MHRFERVMPVTYRKDFAEIMDGRTRLGREVQARIGALESDLGGHEALSHAQRSLIHRAVWLELSLEHEEARIAKGEGVDIAPHVALVGSLLGIYKALGLKRAARKVTLDDYIGKGDKP